MSQIAKESGVSASEITRFLAGESLDYSSTSLFDHFGIRLVPTVQPGMKTVRYRGRVYVRVSPGVKMTDYYRIMIEPPKTKPVAKKKGGKQ